MNNLDQIKADLINSISQLPNIKRLKELESIIDSNPNINTKFDDLKLIQQNLVNARYYKVQEKVVEYQSKLDNITKEINDIPFLDEYLELLEEAYLMLNNVSKIISDEISNDR